MIIGVTTEVLAGEGDIFVAGAIDTHIHFICPQLCIEVKLIFCLSNRKFIGAEFHIIRAGSFERNHYIDRWRDRTQHWHERHHLHSRQIASAHDAPGNR